MRTFTLYDASFLPFGQNSASLGGERRGEQPITFEWRSTRQPGPIFYTDIRLSECVPSMHHLSIAWLIEPYWKPQAYEYVLAHADLFDYILSFRRDYFPADKFLYYPIGGSWIKPHMWLDQLTPGTKTHLASMIYSSKTGASGHRLRHAIGRLASNNASNYTNLDLFGSGANNAIASKVTALAPYYYSVVIESQSFASYFTEKLIDCFSQRTIPIYCGDPSICNTFDCDGILQFSTLSELDEILSAITPEFYYSRLAAIQNNYDAAHQYTCAEDWIYTHYPFLFD